MRISVYDVRGRLVRTVADRLESPGFRTVVWDGRDGSGRNMPSGVYFYSLHTGGEVYRRKVVKLR